MLIAIIPMYAGMFARSEVSPVPWLAFQQSLHRHGIGDAFLQLFSVLTADLWLFWTFGQVWINDHADLDTLTKRMARLINLLGGLVLVTPYNPIYKLID